MTKIKLITDNGKTAVFLFLDNEFIILDKLKELASLHSFELSVINSKLLKFSTFTKNEQIDDFLFFLNETPEADMIDDNKSFSSTFSQTASKVLDIDENETADKEVEKIESLFKNTDLTGLYTSHEKLVPDNVISISKAKEKQVQSIAKRYIKNIIPSTLKFYVKTKGYNKQFVDLIKRLPKRTRGWNREETRWEVNWTVKEQFILLFGLTIKEFENLTKK